jgi:predicted RNA-binding Zn ribbon-like protein
MMKRILSDAQTHKLISGALCLDFANTLYGHGGTPRHEYLHDFRALVEWSQHAGVLSAQDAAALLRAAARQPSVAIAVFTRAIALRETIFSIFAALAQNQNPKPDDLNALNIARLDASSHSRIKPTSEGFGWVWVDETALDRMLWRIVMSAAELLTSDRRARVRMCAGDTCDWLFVDQSRNHLRRWCSMHACGNRAKARRFLERKRKLGAKRR